MLHVPGEGVVYDLDDGSVGEQVDTFDFELSSSGLPVIGLALVEEIGSDEFFALSRCGISGVLTLGDLRNIQNNPLAFVPCSVEFRSIDNPGEMGEVSVRVPAGVESLSYSADDYKLKVIFSSGSQWLSHPTGLATRRREVEDRLFVMRIPVLESVAPHLTKNWVFARFLGAYFVEPQCIVDSWDCEDVSSDVDIFRSRRLDSETFAETIVGLYDAKPRRWRSGHASRGHRRTSSVTIDGTLYNFNVRVNILPTQTVRFWCVSNSPLLPRF